MLYNQRVEFVLQQLQLQSTVKVSDLSRQLQVSVDTVRRDLKAMEQQGLIRCVRGGACMSESRVSMADFTGREIIHSDLKREAVQKALPYIKEGEVVALNSGTTNTILAQELAATGKKCTVVTNNFAAATVLLGAHNIELIFIGGRMDPQERSTYGTQCLEEFQKYHPDIALLSINAVNYKDGYTDFRFDEIGIIQLLAERARQVIAVMDSSKLGKCSKRLVLTPDQVDLLVMDNHVLPDIRDKYKAKGISII